MRMAPGQRDSPHHSIANFKEEIRSMGDAYLNRHRRTREIAAQQFAQAISWLALSARRAPQTGDGWNNGLSRTVV